MVLFKSLFASALPDLTCEWPVVWRCTVGRPLAAGGVLAWGSVEGIMTSDEWLAPVSVVDA